MPSELNFRANIYGFKLLGVERILSASAVGSLQRGVPAARHRVPGPVHRSHARAGSARSSAAASSRTSASRIRSASRCAAMAADARRGGRRDACTAAAPTSAWKGRSSRRWPSRTSTASWGVDIIGMTNLQEAKLAREAEICYATMALVTDYDCWHPDHDAVTVEMIIAEPDAERGDRAAGDRRRRSSGSTARAPCGCGSALATAIITRPDAVPAQSSATWRRSSASTCQRPARARASSDLAIPSPETRAPETRHETHRHRFDRLRLPDVVSRASSPSTCCPSTCTGSASAFSSTRWTSGAAAARRTSPTRWRCSASGRC